MKARHAVTVLAVTGAAATAGAQVTATFSIAFGAPNGPNTVQLDVGQSTAVYVNIMHSGSAPNPILGFAGGGFSIIGTGVAGGAGTWGVDSNTASPTYSLPNPWGAQALGFLGVNPGTGSAGGVSGVVWGFGFGFWPWTFHPAPYNPATVWQGTFTATAGGNVGVSFGGFETTQVVTDTPPLPTLIAAAQTLGGTGTINIPAPATLALLGLGGVAALQRRRA